jgi:hypothetical protein
MGNKMEKNNWKNKWMDGLTMGECKDRQKSLALLKQNVNILKEDMEDYHWVMFTHAMDIFKEWASFQKLKKLKKSIQKQIFTSLLDDSVTKDLVFLGTYY